MLKFMTALKADMICPRLDRKHTAQLLMVAAKENLEYPMQQFHKTYSR